MTEQPKRSLRDLTQDEVEAFIRIWQQSETVAATAEASGLTPAQAKTLAHRLRVKGIPLQKLTRWGKPMMVYDFERLIEIARDASDEADEDQLLSEIEDVNGEEVTK